VYASVVAMRDGMVGKKSGVVVQRFGGVLRTV
jgi:hypothetical protein